MTIDSAQPSDSVTLAQVKPPQVVGSDASSAAYREEKQDLETRERECDLDDRDQDRRLRKTYANRVYWLCIVWIAGVVVVALLQGACSVRGWFNLSDKVLMSLIGGTTVSVLGVFVIVVRSLFPERGSRRRR